MIKNMIIKHHVLLLILLLTFAIAGNAYLIYDKFLYVLKQEYYRGAKDVILYNNCINLLPYRGELVKMEGLSLETCEEIEGILDKKYHYPNIFPKEVK